MYSVCSIHALGLEEIRDTIDETGMGKEGIEARGIDMIEDDDLDYVMHASDAANNASTNGCTILHNYLIAPGGLTDRVHHHRIHSWFTKRMRN